MPPRGDNNMTEADILKLRTELTLMMRELFDTLGKSLEDRLDKSFNRELEHIREDLKRYADYHKQHFESSKALTQAITDSRESILKEVDSRFENKKQDYRWVIGVLLGLPGLIIGLMALFGG